MTEIIDYEEMDFPPDIKKTKQREEMFRILLQASEPMTAQEIYMCLINRMKKNNFAISTVYRGLTVFEEKGYVEKTTLIGEDLSYYEWVKGRHRHYAVCMKCRRMIPLKFCPFYQHSFDQEKIEIEEEGFQVSGHRMEIYGFCRNCRE